MISNHARDRAGPPITALSSTAAPEDQRDLFHIAFYKFVALPDVDAVVLHLRDLTSTLSGSILVAEEGINGVLAGSAAALARFERDLLLDARFAGMVFKRSACRTAPFARMKVHRKSEIVALGIDGASASKKPGQAPTAVTPQQWRELIAQEDVVVIDNRNSFEFKLGKFKNAIDPGIDNFRDFPKYIEAHAPEWKAAGKRVAMYCTGGIRCEKTSPWMQEMGLTVLELEGGILNYFQAMPDAERDWEGECFVFDNRIALDTRLQESATTPEDVYGGEPEWEWRLLRAQRLDHDVD